MKKKALFLDIDGTLIGRKDGPFPEDLAAIAEARRQGHRVFLNTGRSFANIPEYLCNVEHIDGIIAACGSHVLLNGETVYHKTVAAPVLERVCTFYLKLDKWCVWEGETGVYSLNFDEVPIFPQLIPIKTAADIADLCAGKAVSKLTVEGAVSVQESELLQDDFTINTFKNHYFEGIIKGESKSKGMGIVLEAIGFEREQSIAVGDSLNDMDAIRFARIGVAMGNACAELKAAAVYTTARCGEGGVRQVIEHFVLNERSA
ncbi:HAD family hydrolase [Breznakiellaceae bacterium SP9]